VSKISVTIRCAGAVMSFAGDPAVMASDRFGTTCAAIVAAESIARHGCAYGKDATWHRLTADLYNMVQAIGVHDPLGGAGDIGKHLAGGDGRCAGARG